MTYRGINLLGPRWSLFFLYTYLSASWT